jgi:CheY-like chemotaxis protein
MNEESLMRNRIRKILMICSNYDAFILEEDGCIESEVTNEYKELNLSNPPRFIWANSSSEARDIIESDDEIDLVICMYNEQDDGLFALARDLKSSGRNIPFILLIHYSQAVVERLANTDLSCIDYMFSWHGNADLILAIVKLIEDSLNAENDVFGVGVQVILLVEDSVRYYSNYLPELYKLVLTQSREFLKETLNYAQQKYRKRSRPKIFLATCYDEAVSYFEKYKTHLLGVISDVGMIVHRGDNPKDEKLDAGLELVAKIKEYDPLMPVLLQSSQDSVAEIAKKLGVSFMKKYSRTLLIRLSDLMKDEFGFGDFIFKDAEGKEYGRAANLTELEKIIYEIPNEILVSNTSKNMFSKWLYARGLFDLARTFKAEHHTDAGEFRTFLLKQIRNYHKKIGRGIIADFRRDSYEDYYSFARLGNGSMGGKARGLAFLNHLVQKYDLADKYPGLKVSIPRTIVITTDFFDQFILENGLQYIIDSEMTDEDVLSEFVSSRLPEALLEDLRVFITTAHFPLAVRSSSKLEDSSYQPFAGVYSTYMCPLVENNDRMLRELSKAIKSVYASTYFNGSRTYIQASGNLLAEEKMAVIVQDMCGSRHGDDFFPMLSGVARSINAYPIGSEKAKDGILNVAFGLGKTVVDGGRTLRVDPKQTRKILQLSSSKLAMRDTQNEMYVLDNRLETFKISRDDGFNLRNIPIAEGLSEYDHPELVASTYVPQDDMITPGITADGVRIVSFDGVFQYDRFPLAKAMNEIMGICRKELMCEVEIEFALDPIADSNGSEAVLKLLQVRPIASSSDSSSTSIEEAEKQISSKLITSVDALGNGYFLDMSHIVIIFPDSFDKMRTMEMAEEISQINSKLSEEGKSYILVGPGRWGSSIPTLGVPVSWTDISGAKMVVEYGIDGFRIEPSQGTHFFQNITSLGVGYLSVDQYAGKGTIDFDKISKLKCVHDGKFAKVMEVGGLMGFIDRNKGQAVIGY